MTTASVGVDPARVVGPVRSRTFGSFVEHLGRCVYTGIFEPGHPAADPTGFRTDVLELVRELGVTMVRYPGGNFVSGYRWEDGVGPVADRPARLDLAWHSTDPNTFGTDEFIAWCRAAGVEPMMAVNLGTRGLQEALDLLEYCNVRGGTALSDRRIANGSPEPHGVTLWCLGNEMDGPWQLGHKTPYEYGRLATEVARGMRQLQSGLELVACGSSARAMPTFGEWERVVLTEAYEHVDLISAHAYYSQRGGELGPFLASAVDMDRFIEGVVATADAVGAARKNPKQIGISFDEWNVWDEPRAHSDNPGDDVWPVAPAKLEDHYTVADAVVVGNLLISLLRHTDRVHAACLAQLVNVIAPIMTEPGGKVWKHTIFHPFALTARYAKGEVLDVWVKAATYPTATLGEVPLVDAVATHDPSSGELAMFAVNRATGEPTLVEVDLRAVPGAEVVEAVALSNPDPYWQATAADDSSVAPQPLATSITNGILRVELPPVSWAMVRLVSTSSTTDGS